tara:strand:+ start:1067 stop:1330 length:264 start_codon:yes stop_codon:yes gene_type:complete
MSSYHNTTLNFSHAPYKSKNFKSNVDREIKMGELRLRYVQLMRDVHSALGEKEANILIKESEAIWVKLSNPKILENQTISKSATNAR